MFRSIDFRASVSVLRVGDSLIVIRLFACCGGLYNFEHESEDDGGSGFLETLAIVAEFWV